MKRSSHGVDLADFLASRAALQRKDGALTNASAAAMEGPMEKIRRMEQACAQKSRFALPSTWRFRSLDSAIDARIILTIFVRRSLLSFNGI